MESNLRGDDVGADGTSVLNHRSGSLIAGAFNCENFTAFLLFTHLSFSRSFPTLSGQVWNSASKLFLLLLVKLQFHRFSVLPGLNGGENFPRILEILFRINQGR